MVLKRKTVLNPFADDMTIRDENRPLRRNVWRRMPRGCSGEKSPSPDRGIQGTQGIVRPRHPLGDDGVYTCRRRLGGGSNGAAHLLPRRPGADQCAPPNDETQLILRCRVE